MMKERRILIVDDEPYNLIGLRIILNAASNDLDHLIDTARNGLEAFEAVKKCHYGLIFMDCNMPLMNGYEATEKIREYSKDN
jgi:YesN/AraC family two-component response regulator